MQMSHRRSGEKMQGTELSLYDKMTVLKSEEMVWIMMLSMFSNLGNVQCFWN